MELNLIKFLEGKEVLLVEADGIKGLIEFQEGFKGIVGTDMDSFKAETALKRNNGLHVWANMDYILALDAETGNYELFRNA